MRGAQLDAAAQQKAEALLETLRETAMRRGAISERQSRLRADIAIEIEVQGIPAELAQRIAFQLVFKFDVAELAGQDVWRAIGQLFPLCGDVGVIRDRRRRSRRM